MCDTFISRIITGKVNFLDNVTFISTKDGFAYEAEAIKGWLDSGHMTSPMTKLTFSHRHLILNCALRSAIEEYMRQQQKLPLQLVQST